MYILGSKTLLRLIFGKEINFDYSEFYKDCVRARTFKQHMADKNFQLEHTKPLFNELKLLTLHDLYIYQTFIDTLKGGPKFLKTSFRIND